MNNTDIVICGAGIAGIATAYYLSTKYGVKNITLVDPLPPLSLTSDNSTECYRNWWPGPDDSMIRLLNQSIDLMQELADQNHNVFHINRRGYLYLTCDTNRAKDWDLLANRVCAMGTGPLRIHVDPPTIDNYAPSPINQLLVNQNGVDLIVDPKLIRKHYPFLTYDVVAALHVRRAGWLSAQQLGMYMLEIAKKNGIKTLQKRIVDVKVDKKKVTSVVLEDNTQMSTRNVVIAAGPFTPILLSTFGVELPIYNELHLKLAIKDNQNIIDRAAPLLIWSDPITLPWSQDERDILAKDDKLNWLLQELPPGLHSRPEGKQGSQTVLLLWDYNRKKMDPKFPIPIDPLYVDVVMRGISRMIPGMNVYLHKIPRPRIDGGYYTKTPENRPLIGKLQIDGLYIIGAMSGFGIMASCASGELLAKIMTNAKIPNYAKFFSPERYDNVEYQQLYSSWEENGQL